MRISFFVFQLVFLVITTDSVPDVAQKWILDDPRCQKSCIIDGWISTENMADFPKNCSTLCAPDWLRINSQTDLTEAQMTKLFKNVKVIIGGVHVAFSKYTSAKFFENVETVDCGVDGIFDFEQNNKMTEIGLPNLKIVTCDTSFHYNPIMTKLNVPNLKIVPGINNNGTGIAVSENHPDFCITVGEMQNFLSSENVTLYKLEGKYCDVPKNSNITFKNEKFCDIDNQSILSLDHNCTFVKGEVKIKHGEEAEVEKLKSVKKIFGNILISGTNLTVINFFNNLEDVITIQTGVTAILVEFNVNLIYYSFPKLKRVQSVRLIGVEFNSNTEDLKLDPQSCFKLSQQINEPGNTVVWINGLNCDKVQEYTDLEKDKAAPSFLKFSIFLFVLVLNLW